MSPRRLLVTRFLLSVSAKVGVALAGLVLGVALVTPLLWHYNPSTDVHFAVRLLPPAPAHPFGTDSLGRDVLVRAVYGLRASLAMGVVAVAIGLTLGTLLGLLAGFFRGRLEIGIGWLSDTLLSFPTILLAIVIVSIAGPGLVHAMIAVGIVQIPIYTRLARSTVLGLREREFVLAARSLGASSGRVLFRDILPSSLPPLIIQSTLSVGIATLEAAGLGFLGLGAQPPAPELGSMISSAFKEGYALTSPWTMIFPGAFIVVIVFAFNLIGDGFRDALDPRSLLTR